MHLDHQALIRYPTRIEVIGRGGQLLIELYLLNQMSLLLLLERLHSKVNNLIFCLRSTVLLDFVVEFYGNTQDSLIDMHLFFNDDFELHFDRG